LLLTIKDDTLFIDWFHKRSFSGRFLSFYSGHPLCHKVDMIYGLVDRAFLLSHPMFHKKNLQFIIKLLMDNSYPLNLIFKKINSRLKTLIYNNRKFNSDNCDYRLNFSRDTELITATLDNSQYITGYRILNNLGKFIKAYKDTNNHFNNNNVVYKILQ